MDTRHEFYTDSSPHAKSNKSFSCLYGIIHRGVAMETYKGVLGELDVKLPCLEIVATRPQMVRSLCFSVIPGLVLLTHRVLEGFITE